MHTRKIDKNGVLEDLKLIGERIERLDLTPVEKETAFKTAVTDHLMAAAMMAEIDVFAVDELAESYRVKLEMLAKIRADNYVTIRRGYEYAHCLLTDYGIQQRTYFKILSSVGGTPMSRHSKNMSTYRLLGGAAAIPHGNSKAATILDILNE